MWDNASPINGQREMVLLEELLKRVLFETAKAGDIEHGVAHDSLGETRR